MKSKQKDQIKKSRNKAKITSCKLHSFDCDAAIKREKAKQEKWGVSFPVPPIAIKCRCKNCGGTISVMYAAPYMDALKHVSEKEDGE